MIAYWVEDKHGIVIAEYPEKEYNEAKDHAESVKGMLIEATYTFDDSELIHDFRKGV